MSEPNAGSDVVSMRLKAEKKGKASCHKAAGKGRETKSGMGRGRSSWGSSLLGSQQGGRSSVDGPAEPGQETCTDSLSLRRPLHSEWQQVLDHQWPRCRCPRCLCQDRSECHASFSGHHSLHCGEGEDGGHGIGETSSSDNSDRDNPFQLVKIEISVLCSAPR